MKRISITAIIAMAIWVSFVIMGYQGIQSVAMQNVQGYPNDGQIRFYIVLPSIVATAVALSAICFWFNRLKALARAIQVFSLVALFPYLFFYTGGM
ncbi:MAG: hypothetical protein M0P19_06555 [Nevskia sp.]|jgi:hypothetical protein|nr:hypothetical protein [Nevskia sp.]MCK9385167.1 hypothetical protein [Nevskia sp.]